MLQRVFRYPKVQSSRICIAIESRTKYPLDKCSPGQTFPHDFCRGRLSLVHTVDTVHTGLLRFRPVVLRWSYGDAPEYAGVVSQPDASHWVPVDKKWNHRGHFLPGERLFNTVYRDSMRCLSASLRCGFCGPRFPHRSDAGTENLDSVNEALQTHGTSYTAPFIIDYYVKIPFVE